MFDTNLDSLMRLLSFTVLHFNMIKKDNLVYYVTDQTVDKQFSSMLMVARQVVQTRTPLQCVLHYCYPPLIWNWAAYSERSISARLTHLHVF